MNTQANTEIAVVGPGAIGTTVAAMLHEVGRTPLLCGRSSRDYLTLQDGDRLVTVPGPVRTIPAQIAHPVDLVFLAVKATQTEAAAEWLTVLTGPAAERGRTAGSDRSACSARTDRSRCRVVSCAGAVRWLGTLARQRAPQPARYPGFPRGGRSAAGHAVLRRPGRKLQFSGLAQAVAERRSRADGAHAPPVRHV
jgi:ketopantoate reductase